MLKPKHSLVGKNYLGVITKLREAKADPKQFARLKRDHKLEDYKKAELYENIEGLVGVPAGDILQCAARDDDVQSARLALHLIILQANLSGQPRGVPLTDPGEGGGGGEWVYQRSGGRISTSI